MTGGDGATGQLPALLEPRQVALAGLLRCHEPPVPAPLAHLVNGLGPEEAWAAIADGLAPDDVMALVAPRLAGLDRVQLDLRAADDVQRARAAGAELLGPGDADWPDETFAGLDALVPYDGCRTAAGPLALYRRGDRWPVDPRRAVSVVGSRSATAYGQRVATELGAGLAAGGMTVVSGAAFGVDVAAHRGALHGGDLSGAPRPAGGVTVAVLACGIDRSYPVAHRTLLDAAASSGAVVSEYPPGAVPARHRFLVRNRLIAAFGGATVVVEAGRRSGSLNTATSAGSLGRQVLAVPGPVSSAMSAGCHDLIRQRRAELVTDARDVIALVGPLVPADPVHRPGDRAIDGLDLVASRVHEALPARGGASVHEIAAEAGLPVFEVLGALAELEMRDLAVRAGSSWRRQAS
jgi:DNA processing protein